jgi:Homing endonuclease associated repeat
MSGKKVMTREEVISVIRQTAEEVGHAPSMAELMFAKRLRPCELKRHFPTYKTALEACGLERHGKGYAVTLSMLFEDWSGVILRLGKVPTMAEYSIHGRHSAKLIARRFGGWAYVAEAMVKYAHERGLEDSAKDVLEVAAQHLKTEEYGPALSMWTPGPVLRPGVIKGEPIYGTPTVNASLILSPTNEQGVVFLFGAVARRLGFVVLRLQTEFPDCEALREMEPDQWQKIKIEFEYESKNFLTHGHRPDKCNLIVCWRHNWEESPLEVIELRTAVRSQ